MSSDPRTGTEKNLTVVSGADLVILHTVSDDEGTAVDLTDADLAALVKADVADADADAVAAFTVSVVSAAAGTVKMTLPETETAKLTHRVTYYYDLHVTLPADHADLPNLDDTPIWGTLTARQIVTRSST